MHSSYTPPLPEKRSAQLEQQDCFEVPLEAEKELTHNIPNALLVELLGNGIGSATRLSSVEINEITTHCLHPLTIGCPISEANELVVTGVWRGNFVRMLDGAPVLLCSRRDFCHVSNQAVHVRTIATVKAFQVIQVGSLPRSKMR